MLLLIDGVNHYKKSSGSKARPKKSYKFQEEKRNDH